MPRKRNHHFVPQFYLRTFRSAPKRIHLYDLKSMEPRKAVGIKGQCYKRYFHGKNGYIEDAMSELENGLSKTLQVVTATKKLPDQKTTAFHNILTFVCLQYLRTAKRTETFRRLLDKSLDRAFQRSGGIPEGYVLEQPELIMLNLSMIPDTLRYILDLRPHLVVSPKESFFTSDAPVYLYNQYCEGIRDRGVTGLASRGIQIFLPLSPSIILMLYDGNTYKINRFADRWSDRSITDKLSDIDQLNLLQLFSAEKNLYFPNWGQLHDIERLVPVFERMRVRDPQTVREYEQDDDPNSSLLVTFERMVNMSLDLSFMKIRSSANRIPLFERPSLYRDRQPQIAEAQLQDSEKATITFSRFRGES